MKLSSPRSVALIIAIVLCMMVLSTALLLKSTGLLQLGLWWILGGSLLLMLLAALVSILLIDILVERRIRIIYRQILRHKLTKENQPVLNMNEDVIGNVRNQASSYSEAQEQMVSELQSREKFRREFIGNLSHELKTPVFNMQGYLDTLREGALEDEAVNKNYLESCAHNLDRMIAIIKDLDEINALESGRRKIKIVDSDIVALVKEVFEHCALVAKEKEVILRFKEDYQSSFVRMDKDAIQQVLINLVVNAIHYGRQGGFVEARFYDTDGKILIEIADNGPGIEEHHLTRLFERFYRVDKSRSRNQGGTGLGLAIVKHIIEGHGQQIRVRSTPGVGSTFSFTLDKSNR